MKNLVLIPLAIFLIAFSCHMPIEQTLLSEYPLRPVNYYFYTDASEADPVYYPNDFDQSGVNIIPLGDSIYVDVCWETEVGAQNIYQSAYSEGDTLVLILNGHFPAPVSNYDHYLMRYVFENHQGQGFYYRVFYNDRLDLYSGTHLIEF